VQRASLCAALAATLLFAPAGCRSSGGGGAQSFELSGGSSLSVRFEGRSSISEGDLREAVAPDLETAARRSSLRATVDDAAYSAEVLYRRRGFPACTVDYEIERNPEGDAVATLLIAEGPRVKIGSVRFVRPEDEDRTRPLALDEDELRSFVVLPRRLLLPDPEPWYVAGELESARAAVEAFYQSRGWLAAQVRLLAPEPQREADEWSAEVEVVLEVREGPLHRLRSLRVEGGLPEIEDPLGLQSLVGEVALPRLPVSVRSQLREAYARRGHPDADVQVRERESDGEGNMDLVLGVEPGPHVVLGEVRIEGRERTDEARIFGALELDPGAPFDVREQRESFENLYQLGVFSSVAVELDPESTATTDDGSEVRDVTVRVEEAPTTELYAEPGYGSYEQLRLTVGWRERNVLGTARTLEVEGKVSQKSLGGKIGLADPRFLDSDTAANLTFFGGVREEPSYETGEVGGLFSLSRRLSERLQGSLGYQYRFSEVTADDFDDPQVQPLLEKANISSIVLVPTWDARDQAFYPTQGEYARLSLEYSSKIIGSSLDFLRARWHVSHFRELLGPGVLGLSWRGGAIAPFEGTETIPIQERFFNGGENTVRAFKEDQLGPKDSDGNPVGGEAYNVFTAEWRVPVKGRIEWACFYDIGNVLLDVGDVGDLQDYRGGLGTGVRSDLPVGPLRLDMAWNDDPEGDEPAWVLHFSVGFSF
jgi:outer membrane protein assembly complex protein YaeT